MGLNFILPLIAGIIMTVILGSQVAPSLVENMKIKKVENRTIANQELIKDAIVRYIKTNNNAPSTINDIKGYGLIKNDHQDNSFNDGYSFIINKKLGTLIISTKINDDAKKYFSNTLKFPNKPNCKQALDSNGVCVSGEFETFYLLDNDTSTLLKTWGEKNYENLVIKYPAIFKPRSNPGHLLSFGVYSSTPSKIQFDLWHIPTNNRIVYKKQLIDFVKNENVFSYSYTHQSIESNLPNDESRFLYFVPISGENGDIQRTNLFNFLGNFVTFINAF